MSDVAYLLRHPEEAGLALLFQGRPLFLRIINEPAFTPHRSWSLYGPAANDPRLLVVRLSQEPSQEPSMLGGKLVHRISYLEPAQANPLLEEGAEIRVPLFDNDFPSGLDGEFWTFEGAEAFWGIRLRWWCDGPPKWKPLVDWVRRVADFLDG